MVKKIIKNYLKKFGNYISVDISFEIKKQIVLTNLIQRNRQSTDILIDKNNSGLTVSLTTFGRRINDVFLTIESLGLQTHKPGRIVLWLDQKEFNNLNIPNSLKCLQERELTINYCKDLKSYKKLIPSILNYPEDIIITVDDDAIYNFNLVEILYRSYKLNPKFIHCGICRTIKFEKQKLYPYQMWEKNSKQALVPDLKNFTIGVGGVLYFPGCFDENILNEDIYMKLSPYSDDIWFNTMRILKSVKVVSVFNMFSSSSIIIPLEITQRDSLARINILNKKIDKQLKDVFTEYHILNLLMNN